eukprot:2881752-Rhodomonas_salina.1
MQFRVFAFAAQGQSFFSEQRTLSVSISTLSHSRSTAVDPHLRARDLRKSTHLPTICGPLSHDNPLVCEHSFLARLHMQLPLVLSRPLPNKLLQAVGLRLEEH